MNRYVTLECGNEKLVIYVATKEEWEKYVEPFYFYLKNEFLDSLEDEKA